MNRVRVACARSTCAARTCSLVLLCLLAFGGAPSRALAAVDDEELRRLLTEREDKLRVPQPWQTEIAGRPLTISGGVDIDFEQLRRPAGVGTDDHAADRGHARKFALEVEAFYSASPRLSLFAQARLAREKETTGGGTRRSTHYAERGEMWLHARPTGGSPFTIQVGRLKFEDDRRWWWDEELDSVRFAYEERDFEIELAVARELARTRTDRSSVDPEKQRVRRIFMQAGWDWATDQTVSVIGLRHDDRSARESIGQVFQADRQDGTDARLTWFGATADGHVKLASGAYLSYSVDAARVRGSERVAAFSSLPASQSVVEAVERRSVRGSGVDATLRWTLPVHYEPRILLAYARGSGGASAAATGSTDRAFRQTGLQTNEFDVGAVKRFARYGAALDPELSNLRIATVGLGMSPTASTSLDLVYHRYRQVIPAAEMRNARIAPELTGVDRDIGRGLDLVAALQAWDRFELVFVASAFRAGTAFGAQATKHYVFGAVSARLAF